jgi:hypothetical protein
LGKNQNKTLSTLTGTYTLRLFAPEMGVGDMSIGVFYLMTLMNWILKWVTEEKYSK